MFNLYKKYKAYKARKKAILEEYQRQTDRNYHDIRFYNWWPVDDYASLWLYQFVKNNGLCRTASKPINFCSVFGERELLKHVNDGTKIFFSGENLHYPLWSEYADGLLNDPSCHFSLGFDYNNNPRYLRFPLWITYAFEPEINELKIKELCEQLRFPKISKRDKFACLLARADWEGVRTQIFDALSLIGTIGCPSTLLHNDDALFSLYNDDKISYLSNYIFNICPENSNANGYVTEKIFDAITAGCIPVYWGSDNMPEPTVLNPKAIIFWNQESKGTEALKQIQELYTHPDCLEAFLNQPRLVLGAENEIIRMMNDLKNRISLLME